MKLKYILLLTIYSILSSCNETKKGLVISLTTDKKSDTLYISELITEKRIAEIYKDSSPKTIQLKSPVVANIHTKNREKEYLAILARNKDMNISILPDSSLTTNDISDSLVNYLWKSNLEFINKNSSFIFRTKNTDSIPILFDSFRKKREREIDKFKNQFSSQISDILYFQNDARIYSFLFWLGRVSKNLSPNDSYFDFIKDIPKPDNTLKSLPDIYLYKYEIEYLREHKSLEDIPKFLRFIENKTPNKELSDYLKAIYIKALIQFPSYWDKHEKLFNTNVLSAVLESEEDNIYSDIIKEPSSSFYKSQNGEIAYNFKADDILGNTFQLEDLKGKIVFIDVWATWCGPCINHRPRVIEFAEKYKNNDDVKILMVSVDPSRDNWLTFLEKENKQEGINLFIKNGMRNDFGDNYNIKSIPRYILIGKNGKIINSNITEPSIAVEEEIERALQKK